MEKVSCLDCGFRHLNEEYMLGYNPLIQVSNYRAIVDGMKDVAVFSLLILFLHGRVDLFWVGAPHVANNVLMIIDIFSLKRHGHAEFIDVLCTVLSAVLEVKIYQQFSIFNGYRTGSYYVITQLWVYFLLQVLLFLITRLYQKRYNKNIGVCLIKIAFIAQLIVYDLFRRHQTLVGKTNTSVSLLHNLFILLGLSGLGSLLSIAELAMILMKLLTCDRMKTRLMLRRTT